MKIRIGLDLDDVIFDFNGSVLEIAAKNGLYLSFPDSWDYLRTNYVNGKSIAQHIWDEGDWYNEIFKNGKIINGAREGYNKFINNEKYEIYIVTARTGTNIRKLTEDWLDKNNITGYKSLIITDKKLEAPTQCLIDDNYKNIMDYDSNGRLGILMNKPYNKQYNYNPNVNNLNEAYEYLNNIL